LQTPGDQLSSELNNDVDGILSRHTKLKNAARASTSKPSSLNTGNRNLGLMTHMSGGNTLAKGSKRYESSGHQTAVTNTRSQMQKKHRLPIGFMVQKEMKSSGFSNDVGRVGGLTRLRGNA